MMTNAQRIEEAEKERKRIIALQERLGAELDTAHTELKEQITRRLRPILDRLASDLKGRELELLQEEPDTVPSRSDLDVYVEGLIEGFGEALSNEQDNIDDMFCDLDLWLVNDIEQLKNCSDDDSDESEDDENEDDDE